MRGAFQPVTSPGSSPFTSARNLVSVSPESVRTVPAAQNAQLVFLEMTRREQEELTLIEANITVDPEIRRVTFKCPTIKDLNKLANKYP